MNNTKNQLDKTRNQLNETQIELNVAINQLHENRNQLEKRIYNDDYLDNCYDYYPICSKCKIFLYQCKLIGIPKNVSERTGKWEQSMEICKKYSASLIAIESKGK